MKGFVILEIENSYGIFYSIALMTKPGITKLNFSLS